MSVEQMALQLKIAREAYYNEQPIMSDEDFDVAEDKLRELDPTNDYFSLVGAPVTDVGSKRTHKIPMGSQAKIKIDDDGIAKVIANFIAKGACSASYKLDGISFSVEYENQKYKHATTRGDGFVGEDIPNATEFFNVIEDTLDEDYDTFTARGELTMSYDDFEFINSQLPDEDKFSNPRNAVAGIVRKENSPYRKYITALYYDFDDGRDITDKTEVWGALVTVFGIGATPWYALEITADEFTELAERLDKTRKTLPYMIDGIVVEFEDLVYARSLGVANGNKPKGSIAFKFNAVAETTVVTDVVWQVGSTGNLTPVVEFEPTLIDGSIVRRASIHNYDIFSEWDFAEGDIIEVQKNNDIIPQVKRVVERYETSDRFTIPTDCPVCEEFTSLIKVAKTTNLVCINPLCKAKFVGAVKKWATKSGMTTKGVGDAFFESYVDTTNDGLSVSDIYGLSVDDIMSMSERYKTKSATKIYNAIQSSKTMKLMDVFGGFNISGCGSRTFKTIIDHSGVTTIVGMYDYCMLNDLTKIDGIGDTTAKSIVRELPYYHNEMVFMTSEITIIQEDVISSDAHTYLFTGSFNTIDPNTGKGYKRKALEALITSKGNTTASSVNKTLDYLVTSDPDSMSSKMVKARKLGVTILGEDEFFERI